MGDKQGYMALQIIYSEGLGVPRDEREARRWVELADSAGVGQEIAADILDAMAEEAPDFLYEMGLHLMKQGKAEAGLETMKQGAEAGSERAREWLAQRGESQNP